MNDGIAIEEVDGGHDAIPALLFGRDADMEQHGAGQLGEEALNEVEPGAMLGCGGELEAARGLLGKPGFGLPGDMRGMIVEDEVDRGAMLARRPMGPNGNTIDLERRFGWRRLKPSQCDFLPTLIAANAPGPI